MVVVGAGIIGCEYASMFAMAGTKVTLVDRRHEILASVDREIVDHLVERFVNLGVDIVLEADTTEIEKKTRNGGLKVHLKDGRTINTETVLIALGRQGNTDALGLEEVGVKRDERGLIKVDPFFRTSIPNIYAIGDVI